MASDVFKMVDGRVVRISLSRNNQATVWHKDDVLRLRRQHRIVGSLIGSLPRKPWQNQVMSLPLLLLPEEVTLLLRKGCAVLRRENEPTPSRGSALDFKKLRDKSYLDQIRIFVRERENKKRLLDRREKNSLETQESIGPKYSKIEEVVSEKAAPGVHIRGEFSGPREGSEITVDDTKENSIDDSSNNEVLRQVSAVVGSPKTNETPCEISQNDLKYYSKATWVHIPTASVECSNQSESPSHVNWTFPSTDKQKISYAVFCDLWEKGYFITTGEKFGCDFLVYPGEPSRYHSQYIVLVMSSTQKLSPMEFFAYGRLGGGVKKTVVFAIVDKEKDFSVTYNSLSWTGADGLSFQPLSLRENTIPDVSVPQ